MNGASISATPHAVRQFAEGMRTIGAETRDPERELCDLAALAHRVEGDTEEPQRWRYRRKSVGIDLGLRMTWEGATAVIVSCSLRAETAGGASRAQRARRGR